MAYASPEDVAAKCDGLVRFKAQRRALKMVTAMIKLDPWDIARIDERKRNRGTRKPKYAPMEPLRHAASRAPVLEPIAKPWLDRKVALRPLSAIRLERKPYQIGRGPSEPGIYFLFAGFRLVYVGQSVDVAARLRSHAMKRLDDPDNAIRFNMYAAIPVPRERLDEVESHYIVAHQPPRNTKGLPEDIQYARRVAQGLARAAGSRLPRCS